MNTTPRYTKAQTLLVTGVDDGTLQNWVNPKRPTHLKLAQPSPGKGQPRLYSAIDVVKVAILKRFANFGINIGAGMKLAEETGSVLKENDALDWDLYVTIDPSRLAIHSIATVVSSPRFYSWGHLTGDARQLTVFDITERRNHILAQRRDFDGEIIPTARLELASAGVHLEPALIFPLGEVVNGTLAQLLAIDEAGAVDQSDDSNR